ncbi:UDP-N-acetylglucosamine 2-epimerase [Synechococcus sp. UW140]|uniref:UDP-N-acetylglucosamine 2-epimerase n=1 Tax=Synechococcus sp. UW140 TaxID=368503 RepID=UPI003137F3C8
MSGSALRKVCIVTGTRADYGLLRWVIDGIQSSKQLQLQLVVTGMHLSPEFGLTVHQIEADGYPIDWRVEMLLSSDTAVGITKSMGLGLIGFADALAHLQPDLLLVLGDRYEIMVAVQAAMIARIPIAHLHGGELTEGAFDDAIRHSITKMAHLHFVAAEEYRQRLIQLGEQPERVFCVGGLGIDNIKRLDLLNRQQLEESLNLKLGECNLLVTFHPVTLEKDTAAEQMAELLNALNQFPDVHLIFTMPNADNDGRVLFQMIENYVHDRPNSCAFTSLGQLRYLSCIQHVDGVVGNSSSGLAEVPSFRKPTINIGDRQRGRLKAESVIDCLPKSASITASISIALSPYFQQQLQQPFVNPYGEGGASEAIVTKLEAIEFTDLLKKSFYVLECDQPVR